MSNNNSTANNNVAKYMALLEREKDLKSKLQQMFLKKHADEAALNAEITRLKEQLENSDGSDQAVRLSDPIVRPDQQKLESDLEELQAQFNDNNRKLANCRTAYLDLDEKNTQNQALLEEKDKEIFELQNSLKEASKTKKNDKVQPEKSQKSKKSDSSGIDDLTLINGIGPKLRDTLHDLGVTSFEEIASWKVADIKRVEEGFKLKGRIKRDEWVKQAKKLK